jgi:hypothetical protein
MRAVRSDARWSPGEGGADLNARRLPQPWTFEDHNNACFYRQGRERHCRGLPSRAKGELVSALWFKTRLHYTKETLGNFFRDLPVA